MKKENAKEDISKVRIDKWLWAVRVFKSRSLSAENCDKGRVKIENEPMKPSHLVKIGDIIHVRKGVVNHQFKVIGILTNRVGAKLVNQYLQDLTPADQKEEFLNSFFNPVVKRDKGTGRPTKKDRREIDGFFD